MADSVVKLRIDSKEYDANIKRASQALTDYFKTVKDGGGTLKYLDDGVLEAVQAMGSLGTKAEGTRGALRELTQATTDMTVAYRSLTDEEKASPIGQELSKSIAALTERAGNARDAMADVSAAITHAASDTRAFDQVSGAVSLMTSGFQTAVGAANLFGIEIGNQEQVLATLASAMSITNGLQTAQNLLQKQSSLMMGVQAAQAAVATAAQTALAAATGNATLAQKAFNVVANMNPYVALATAVAAVGTALYAFTSASSKAKKEAEDLAKAEEEAAKKADDARNTFVNAAASAMNTASRISSLQLAYKQANSEMEKTSILRQAQTEFKKLGMECKGVDDAQNLLIKNGSKVIEMIRLQGEAAALSSLRMEAFKKSFKMLKESGYSAGAAATLAGYNEDVVELDKQITAIQGRMQNLRETLPTSGTSMTKRNKATDKVADPMAENSQKITNLTNEYVTATDTRRQAIEREIAVLQKRNEEIQKLKDVAQGKAFDAGALPEVTVKGNKQVSIEAQFKAAPTNFDSIDTYISGIKDRLKTADIGTDLYQSLTEKIKDATTMSTLLQNLMDMGVQGADLQSVAATLKEKLLSPEGIDQNTIQAFLDEINKQIEEQGGVKLKLNADGSVEQGNESDSGEKNLQKKYDQLTGGLSQVASGLKNIGVDIPKEVSTVINVLQGISQVIQGVQTVISVFATSSQAANTAAVSLNTAAIGGLIAAMQVNTASNFIPFFRGGGIVPHAAGGWVVPGNDFADRTPVLVSSGELILNRAQQGNLASQLEGGSMQGLHLETHVSGEDLVVVLNRNSRRRLRGEYVTSKQRMYG